MACFPIRQMGNLQKRVSKTRWRRLRKQRWHISRYIAWKLFRSVLSAFGGKLEVITSGGAPLDESYVRGFESLGITVLNGYGITECGPVVAVNRNRYNIVGSVGLPLPCNEVKIAPDGEILIKGANVMQGYYHMEKENERFFTDGWFKTGDIGRKKNLIILANGENILAEEVFAVEISDRAVRRFKTVGDVMDYIEQQERVLRPH